MLLNWPIGRYIFTLSVEQLPPFPTRLLGAAQPLSGLPCPVRGDGQSVGKNPGCWVQKSKKGGWGRRSPMRWSFRAPFAMHSNQPGFEGKAEEAGWSEPSTFILPGGLGIIKPDCLPRTRRWLLLHFWQLPSACSGCPGNHLVPVPESLL